MAALIALILPIVASAAIARASTCAWGPITDVPRGQVLLREWANAHDLSAFDADRSSLSIDGNSSRLTLQFAPGSLALAWRLNRSCDVTDVSIVASGDYAGRRPSEAAVREFAESLHSVGASPQRLHGRGLFDVQVSYRVAAFLAAAIVALASWLLSTWRRAAASGVGARGIPRYALSDVRTMSAINRIRLVGVAVIVALVELERSAASDHTWLGSNPLASIAVSGFVGFLWLALTGFFGYGAPQRGDWPALLSFLFALGLRTLYARHGVEGDVLHFGGNSGFDSHSIVYTLYLSFIHPLARDHLQLQIYINAVLASLATLPLYLFVRQRTGDRTAALAVSTFYAVHPILLQMAGTDSPYSLCFATWFSGLVLLTGPRVGARQLVGGGILLGIAAVCRPEGALFLAATLLLVDVPALLRAARAHLTAAAFALTMVVGMLAAEIYFVFSMHTAGGTRLPVDECTAVSIVKAGLWSTDYNDPLLAVLVVVGMVAGLVDTRLRVGLGAALGAVIVVWPMCATTTGGYILLHRLNAACFLQLVAAGVGAAWLTSWPAKLREHWASALPAVMAALVLLVVHRHEIHDPHGLSDEFWMLRTHLAPGGVVDKDCTLVWWGRTMDTDIHNFGDVVPGMKTIHCHQEDCLAAIAQGGCFYYMRGLNCFHSEAPTKPECLAHGKTETGGSMDCIEPECVRMETVLRLELVEQRTVDAHSIWNYEGANPPDRHVPVAADVALYRVLGMRP